jgi:hypothetical protein
LGLVCAAGVARAETFDLGGAMAVAGATETNPTFATTGATTAYFWRLEPQLGLGYDSERLTAKLHAVLDAEIYDDAHQNLSTPWARQALEGGVHSQLTPELDLSVDGAYYGAAIARDLPVVPGIDRGRVRTDAGGGRIALGDWLDKRTELGVEYSFLHEAQAGVSGDVHTEDLAVAWKESRRTTLRADLIGREIVAQPLGATTLTPMLGWSYALGPMQQHLSLRAGPRLGSDGIEDLEADAALRLRGEDTLLEILYLRTQTIVPGAAEPTASDGLTMKGSATWGAVTVTAAPGLFYTRGSTTDSWSARGELELRWALAPWLGLFGNYRVAWQTVSTPMSAATSDHLVLVGVIAGASATPTAWPTRGADPFGHAEDERAERRLP